MTVATALYAGSFDPPTKGHVDVVERASRLFSRMVVAVGTHPTKNPLFTVDERRALLVQCFQHLPNVEITSFGGLIVDFADRIGAEVIVRGLRAVTDFESELQYAHANRDLNPKVDTIFLPTRTAYGFISSSLVREIASHGGQIEHYVEAPVAAALRSKLARGSAANPVAARKPQG